MEDNNLKEIAEQIYSRPPGEPNSIQLQLDEIVGTIEDSENVIFNILYLITYNGIKILYGNIELLDLTEEQYNIIKLYVRSYGYELVILANDTDKTPWQLQRLGDSVYRYKIFFDNLM